MELAQDEQPLISVVIPCLNGEATLGRQLDALLAQRTSVLFEVVVADNGSTDGTRSLVRGYEKKDPRIRWIDAGTRPGVCAARNDGIKESSGLNILVCDADDVVSSEWVGAYASAFLGGATLVGGPLVVLSASGQEVQRIDGLYPVRFLQGNRYYALGANCGFTREIFDLVDGFDEDFRAGADDVDFFLSAAEHDAHPVFVQEAWVDYYQRPGFRAAFKQGVQYGISDVQLFAKWRLKGMTITPLPRVLIRLAGEVFNFLRDLVLGGRNRRRATRLGISWGRVVGSFRLRTLYL